MVVRWEIIEFRTDGFVLELQWVENNFLRLSKNKLILLEGTDIDTIVQKFKELIENKLKDFLERGLNDQG